MQARSWHDFVQVSDEGHVIGRNYYDWESVLGVSHSDHAASGGSEVESHANGPTIPGSLTDEDSGDMIELTLAAGTYTWSYRGTAENGIVDPWLRLYEADGVTLITEDDDGGLGRTSQITFTTTGGTYWLNASSWYQVDPTAPSYQDNGDYTIVQWSPDATHDAGSTLGTAGTLNVGTNYAYLDAAFDVDIYAIELTAGTVYTFTYNGGVSSGDDWDDEPGESIGVLSLHNSVGATIIGNSVNYETGISYFVETSGTYYVRAQAYSNFGGVPGPEMTGGYTLDVRAQTLAELDPLEAFIWDSAVNVEPKEGHGNTVYIYFAPEGENLTPGETNLGWEQHQIDAVMHALEHGYKPFTGYDYVITEDIEQATFKMITVENNTYGARFYPQDEASYGDLAGVGSFNLLSGGFGTRPESLEPGGFSYAVILHEFGHAHGIAHPHDTGGGSEIMVGVTASTGSFGVFNLNQGVYSVMSYNDAWPLHPDGPTENPDTGGVGAVIDHGWSETLGAFDIAVLQERGYLSQPTEAGDTTYSLTDNYLDASYKTIWDTGGTDTIAYSGALDAQIDLLAATLDYSPTGGGAISFLYNEPQPDFTTEIKGGFTIANGVVIENATGGSGNDVLLGNSAKNVLTGNDGDDYLVGRDGLDVARLGGGNDTFLAEVTATKQNLKTGSMSVDIITDFDALGDDVIDLSGLGVAMNFRGTAASKNLGDLTYKTYSSINGAENAIGLDIDGQPGASGVSGPVTVVYGNTAGNKTPEFAIILLNTSSVDASDFLFGSSSSAFSSSAYAGGGGGGGGADYLLV